MTSDNSRVYEHKRFSLWKHQYRAQAWRYHFNGRPTCERKCVMIVSGTCGSLPLSSCNASYEAWPAIGSCRSSTVSGPPSRPVRVLLSLLAAVTCDQLTRHCVTCVLGESPPRRYVMTSLRLYLCTCTCTYSSDGCKVADGQYNGSI